MTRREEYRRYLKGRLWQAIRGAAIYRAGGVCERCKGTDLLQVHHTRYPKEFGTETPDMLQVLCDPCHAEAHGQPYLIHKLDRERRQARHARIKAMRQEAAAARKDANAKKRAARSRRYALPPTPSLKDRF